jgi:hypothetical protein
MEKIINNFLDKYLGIEVTVKEKITRRHTNYYICSKKTKIVILWFWYNHNSNTYTMFRGQSLIEFVSIFFSIDEELSHKIIKNWFADKHNISKVGDLKKFHLTSK